MAGSGQTTGGLTYARVQGETTNPPITSSKGNDSNTDHQVSLSLPDCSGKSVAMLQLGGSELDAEQANSALISAVWDGDVEMARCLLRAGAEPSREDSLGAIPMHIASTLGNCRLVRLLLAAGADADSEDMNGHCPLHKAAFGGHVDVVRALLDAGSCATGTLTLDTPLHYAAGQGHLEIVKMLLEHDSHILHRADSDGESPLHRACYGGHLEVVCFLASLGADLNARLPNGRQPLHLASDCRCGPSIVDLFQLEDDSDLFGLEGGNFGKKDCFVQDCNCFCVGEHHDAAQVVRFLIQNGCDVNSSDVTNETPLHCAARHPNVNVVEFLLAASADIKARNTYQETPLHGACSSGLPGIVKSLIEHGSDPTAVTSYGATPVHLAFQQNNTSPAMLQTITYLLTYGSPYPEKHPELGFGHWQQSVLLFWAGYYDTAAMVEHFVLSLKSSARYHYANFANFLLVLQPILFKSTCRSEVLQKLRGIPICDSIDPAFNESIARELFVVSPLYQLAVCSVRNHVSSMSRGSSIIPNLEKLNTIISRSITDDLLFIAFIKDILPEIFV